jgi:hypothetical protein
MMENEVIELALWSHNTIMLNDPSFKGDITIKIIVPKKKINKN